MFKIDRIIILYIYDPLVSKCWVSNNSFSKVILNNYPVCGSFFYTLENEINHLFILCKAIYYRFIHNKVFAFMHQEVFFIGFKDFFIEKYPKGN